MRAATCVRAAAVCIVLLTVADADAWPWGRRRFQHADRNKDGRLGPRERRAERRFEKRLKSKVDTPREAKADKNKDGVVGPGEAAAARRKAYLVHQSVVDRPWEAKADRDGDGKVDAAELRGYHLGVLDKNGDGKIGPAERRAFWLAHKAKVNTPYERKYDANKDGFIDGVEAKAMLRDRLRIIHTHGKARVDTALEAQYDANGDGVIDVEEAKAIRDAIED
jgi:hypothetical protein